MTDDEVPSPCVNVCVMNEASGLCRGCARTLDEISRWSDYTRGQKLAVLKKLARRKAAALPPTDAPPS
jgi:hypothetical protein